MLRWINPTQCVAPLMSLTSVLAALVCASAIAVGAEPAAGVPEIVALGDSLTAGRGLPQDRAYPAVLQKRLDEAGLRYKVINAGVSGDTSRRAAARILANARRRRSGAS